MVLLDTHVLIWMAFESSRLSIPARSTIRDSRRDGTGLAISDFTVLELARLDWQKRLNLRISLDAFLQEIELLFDILPMTRKICVQAFDLPASFPRDPADRVIVATALVHGLSLVTADRAIRQSNACSIIW